ncbi:hypothetical protein [Macrococcus epidermidis]|nr:hypothetical protein [Macrococcus epidermidis]
MEKLNMTFVRSFQHPLINERHPLNEQVLFHKYLSGSDINDINQ